MLRLALSLLAPIRRSRRRLPVVERLFRLGLSPREFASLQAACDASGQPLGAFYYWKFVQFAQLNAIRRLDPRATLDMIARYDHSDYATLDARLDDPRGLLLAIPHHGAFVFSIVALAERIRRRRRVLVFYESPAAHATNELFDILHARLFGDGSSGVTILHNDRAGLASALRGLRDGAIVVIMPDVYKDRGDTYPVPFCGRARNAMLGTAVLARRTQSTILPLVSDPLDLGMGFRTWFGRGIEPAGEWPGAGAAEVLCADYGATVAVFAQFEQAMARRLHYWQYCRSHFLGDPAPPRLDEGAFVRYSGLFLRDPRVRVGLDPVGVPAGQEGTIEETSGA